MASGAAYANRMKLVSLICLVVQNTALVLLMRYTRTTGAKTETGEPGEMYFSSTTVVLMEAVKILSCMFILAWEYGFQETGRLISHGLLKQKMELLKMLVPAFLYAMQNNLLFVAITYLDAVTFQVSYQMKILTTAMFTVTILHRSLSSRKWLSLVLLTIGVALVQIPSGTAKKAAKGSSIEPMYGGKFVT